MEIIIKGTNDEVYSFLETEVGNEIWRNGNNPVLIQIFEIENSETVIQETRMFPPNTHVLGERRYGGWSCIPDEENILSLVSEFEPTDSQSD